MSEIRSMYKDAIKGSYHDENVLITSIRYTKKTLVEENLPPIAPDSDTSSSKAASKDPVAFAGSDAFESEVSNVGILGKLKSPVAPLSESSKVSETLKINSVNKNSSRSYSTKVVPAMDLVSYVVPVMDLVPYGVRLLRKSNGKFYIEGINLLKADSPDLKVHLSALIAQISGLMREIESVNVGGYCNLTRLSDIPVISEYLKVYVQSDKPELSDYLKGGDAQDQLGKQGVLKALDNYLTQREKRVLLPWLSSLLNLNMYYLLIDVLDRLGVRAQVFPNLSTEDQDQEIIYDLIEDIQTYSVTFHGNLNPSIRECMRQRGITVSENVYCGFDTEYKNIDLKYNKILSAQWAVNSKLVLSLPYLSDYNLSVMNIDSGKEFPLNSMWFKQQKIGFSSIQTDIRGFVNLVREKRFSKNDECIKNIMSGFIKDGVPYFIDKTHRQINFSFDRTRIKTYFKSSGLEGLDLGKLVQIGLNLESDDMKAQKSILKEKLAFHSKIKDKDKDLNIDSILESNFTNLTSPCETSLGETSKDIEDVKPANYKGRYSRTRKSGFTPEKVSVTTRRNFHVIGHLTQADMSLLSDFETIKKEFDIVNKCMVTLGRSSIVLWGHSIVFRDTLLLAPGGKKSLSAIGGMYGEKLQKLSLTEEQHQNMDILLKNDPRLFKEYALRDSLISLHHACILEDAHFKLNKLGIPLTLSSLGASNLRHSWEKFGYGGYQLSQDYLLGDSRKTPTPKGLFAVGNVGLYLNNYIANYKGGRNESFAIGYDRSST